MDLRDDAKLFECAKIRPIFETVETEELWAIDSLDEAIILTGEGVKPELLPIEPFAMDFEHSQLKSCDRETENNSLVPDLAWSFSDFQRVIHAYQIFPAPMVPVGLAIIALLIAVAFERV